MNTRKNLVYSIAVLSVAALVTFALVRFKPKAGTIPPERAVTTIEAVTATTETVRLEVRSQGTIRPRVRTQLAAEVGGLVTDLSPRFREGGFIRKGEVLAQIDTADYLAAAAAREAELAAAKLALEEEKARGEQARLDWARLGDGEAGPLTLRKPQLEQAEARLKSAEAALDKARRDLERTSVRAPYDGRVEETFIDLGQVISPGPGNPLAVIYATDTAETRLPVSDREAAFLDLSTLDADGGRVREDLPAVRLTGTINGRSHTWEGRIVRTEATIDPRTRFLYLVAEVPDGFIPGREEPSPPLQPGLFVEAVISGSSLPGAIVLPRYALRDGNRVYIIEERSAETEEGIDGYLWSREIAIAQSTADSVVITGGLEDGDRIATSPVAWFVEGMPVRITEEP